MPYPAFDPIYKKIRGISSTISEEWAKTAIIRSNIMLGERIIMPKRIHGIVIIVETLHATSLPLCCQQDLQ